MRPQLKALFVALLLMSGCTAGTTVETAASPPSTTDLGTDQLAAEQMLQQAADGHAMAERLRQAAEADARAARARVTPTTARPKPTKPPAVPSQPVNVSGDLGFWRRLANCESSDGTGGNGGGFFQLGPDTRPKVGFHPGASYEQQLAWAQEWARRIHPREATRAGWPVCWRRALSS